MHANRNLWGTEHAKIPFTYGVKSHLKATPVSRPIMTPSRCRTAAFRRFRRFDCAPASNAAPPLAPLNSLIGHNKEKLGQYKSASRGPPLWSTFSVSQPDT